MSVPVQCRLSRRRFVGLSAATAVAAGGILHAAPPVAAADVSLQVPFFPQGDTGADSGANCGPASVAAAVNYSGMAFPTVQDVRATLGMSGPTDLDQWAWLLSAYGVPWFQTWSQPDMDEALRTGHVMVIAAWMADFTPAPDFEEAFSPFWGQSGRYASFAEGHAMLIVGTADSGANYLVHDPNVWDNGISYYGDGAPKGAYRRYSAAEVWGTIANYADGQALAVPPLPVQAEDPPPSVKRPRQPGTDIFTGPGGGHAPERGERATGIVSPTGGTGVISAADDSGEDQGN